MNDGLKVHEPDRLLHEPARLNLLAQLSVVQRADFTWLLNQTGMTRGNLSVQMTRLSDAGLVAVEKQFCDNRPRTLFQLTAKGRDSLRHYKRHMQAFLALLPD